MYVDAGVCRSFSAAVLTYQQFSAEKAGAIHIGSDFVSCYNSWCM